MPAPSRTRTVGLEGASRETSATTAVRPSGSVTSVPGGCCATTSRNAATTPGSNAVPEPATIADQASAGDIAGRWDRSAVMAS